MCGVNGIYAYHPAARTVLGTDYNGTGVRDGVHRSGLAEDQVKVLDLPLTGVPSDVFNIETGRGYSVREVLDTVSRIAGTVVPVEYGSRCAGDPAALVSDASKLQEALSWQPQFRDLDRIISTVWAWHQHGSALNSSCAVAEQWFGSIHAERGCGCTAQKTVRP